MIPSLRIIGTSHIAAESVREIERCVRDWKPDIVAVELDPMRLQALFTQQRSSSPLAALRIGIAGYLFSLIGSWVQRKLGNAMGMQPGAEMKRAVELAAQSDARVALIDQHVEVTLRRFSKALGWRERLRLLWDIVVGLVSSENEMKRLGIQEMDLTKVPPAELVKKLLLVVKVRYPGIYRVLVEERNAVMARNLSRLREREPEARILAVVGAGHVEGITALLAA
ncbi:TraB/GumN family protein [Candidatus Woesearchaeota archaeon]|nr:TraB/GumN family protein [Candidatus Woesearchaeota archaeon]